MVGPIGRKQCVFLSMIWVIWGVLVWKAKMGRITPDGQQFLLLCIWIIREGYNTPGKDITPVYVYFIPGLLLIS